MWMPDEEKMIIFEKSGGDLKERFCLEADSFRENEKATRKGGLFKREERIYEKEKSCNQFGVSVAFFWNDYSITIRCEC